MLSPAPIGPDGTFRDDGVTVEIDGRAIAASAGAWGGRFSDIADAAGDPRLAAGTAGAEWTEIRRRPGRIPGRLVRRQAVAAGAGRPPKPSFRPEPCVSTAE